MAVTLPSAPRGVFGALLLASMLGAEHWLVAARADAQPGQPNSAELPAPNEQGDEFDSLLRLAEEDVSQLTQVQVSSAPALSTEVTTVNRTASTVGKTPAAVFVITNEMIRRSGATSIPEVLRMAPGVNVARLDSDRWAVSIRGFNGLYTNKLLVQIDGRSIYTPFFGGVFWAAQDVFLEDVERIEVVRGPGASVWGANAVNGVINIITKEASETQGVFVQSGGGNLERGFVNARYGGKIGDDIDYRIWSKWFERGPEIHPSSVPPYDDWRSVRGGFRVDWNPGRCGVDCFTLQGDIYDTPAGVRDRMATTAAPFSTVVDDDVVFRGGNLLARWTHVIDDERQWQLQAYYDYAQFDWQSFDFTDRISTADVDFQYQFPCGECQKVVCGANYRFIADRQSSPGFPWTSTLPEEDLQVLSYFVQDEITLSPERWFLTLGCKMFHHTYTSFEYQPTARLLFAPDDRHSLWASVSRAVRIPSRFEEAAILTLPPNAPVAVFPQFQGSGDLVSEDLLAWECGYRAAPTDYFSWDLALFFNQYEDLIGLRGGAPQGAPFGLVIPLIFDNTARAQSYGFELATTLDMTDDWQLRAAYNFLRLEFLGTSADEEGNAPRNQLYLQSSHELAEGWELDLVGRYVDSLPTIDVPSYFVGDVRLAWCCRPGVELFVVGRSLFDNGHHEFGGPTAGDVAGIRSEVYGGVTVCR